MAIARTISLILMIVLVSALNVICVEDRERREQLLNPSPQAEDENMAKLTLMACHQDLTLLKEAVRDLNFCFPEEETMITNRDLEIESNSEDNVKKLLDKLHPEWKQSFLDCVEKNKLPVYVSEGGSINLCYTKYLELLFSWPNAPKRSLAGQSPRISTDALPPTKAEAEAWSPPPPKQHRHSPPPPQNLFSPKGVDSRSKSPPSREDSSRNSKRHHDVDAKATDNHQKSIITAVIATAVITLFLAALFFLCCIRALGKGSRVKQNDERPLLSLSMSDCSVGSLISCGSSKENMLGRPSISNHSNHQKKPSFDGSFSREPDGSHNSVDEKPSLESLMRAQPPLKPPPGRVGSTLLGPRPPPGRVQPLPPEPPTFLKPPPGMAGPPPPPPPAAPPPQKPSLVSASPSPPAPPPPAPPGPRPPPPPVLPGPKGPRPPPPVAPGPKAPRPPGLPKSGGAGSGSDDDAPKTKLKPFFWDKVLANPDHSMVWHEIKSGSFQFNEEMIESLFGYASADKNKNEKKKDSSSQDSAPQFIQILEPRKAQNLSILLRALNVTTEEVCDALVEGNELPTELLQTLLKMAPTSDEELKLRLFSGDLSQLGPAERFLKAMVDIPFAYKRMKALLFMCTLQEEVAAAKESYETLEVACKELTSSRLFLKLLEAVLKTGNRMNDGTFRGGAQAFKLDTLLKLSDVKGTDGKTTLLHFVVQEIIRSEGVRAARTATESRSFSSVKTEDLMVDEPPDKSDKHYRSLGLERVAGLSSELENVRKAANIDADSLTGTVAKLGHALLKARDFLNSEMESSEEKSGFHEALKGFIPSAESDVTWLLEEEKRIMALVKSTGDYFHGKAGKDEGLRLFVIVRDFLIILDKVCREVRDARRKPAAKSRKKEASTALSSSGSHKSPSINPQQRFFPAIAQHRRDDSSSDSD